MKLKKLGIILFVLMIVVGCSSHSSKSYTFNVSTGDSVEVTMDTSDGDTLSQSDGQFSVNDDTLQGIFLAKEDYDSYINAIESDSSAKIIDQSKNYLFYEYDGTSGKEHNFVLWLSGSDTGILIGSLASEKEAKACYDKLSFEVK